MNQEKNIINKFSFFETLLIISLIMTLLLASMAIYSHKSLNFNLPSKDCYISPIEDLNPVTVTHMATKKLKDAKPLFVVCDKGPLDIK